MPPKRKYEEIKGVINVPAIISRTTASPKTAERFRKATGEYLNNDAFSDFTIICQGRHFPVHRCIISAHSRWFQRCCAGKFREATDRDVTLEDDVVEAVERMRVFFYVWTYDDDMSSIGADELACVALGDPKPVTSIQINAYVYAMADKYEVPDLQALALRKFKTAACDLNGAEDSHLLLQRAIYTVFRHVQLSHSDTTLKDILVSLWTIGGSELNKRIGPEGITELVGEVPEFAQYVFSKIFKDADGTIAETCSLCGDATYFERSEITKKPFWCTLCDKSEPEEQAYADCTSHDIVRFW